MQINKFSKLEIVLNTNGFSFHINNGDYRERFVNANVMVSHCKSRE